MHKSYITKLKQLGVSPGTAAHRLRKMLLFRFAQQSNQDTCYRCKLKIESIDEFSIEHIIPWLHAENPAQVFFDLDNIAYSHMKCNISFARKLNQKYFTKEERTEANRRGWRESKKRNYSTEKRRRKHETTGY